MISAFSALLLFVGLHTHLYLGDEVFHYRFAKQIFDTGQRLPFDPVYGSGKPPGYFYIVEPLWHIILVLIWKLIGNVSFVAAQIYQTVYYVLLILITFFIGRKLYNEKVGLASALVIATIPMVVTFSILFYLDVPAVVYTILFFLLFLTERYWLAGISIALMYMTKRNACFFIPVIPFMVMVKYKKDFLKILETYVSLFVSAGAVVLLDILWRMNHLGSFFKQPEVTTVKATSEHMSNIGLKVNFLNNFQTSKSFQPRAIQNSTFSNPIDNIKYLGIAFFVILILYSIRRKWEKKDLILWIPLVTYILFYSYFFGFQSDVRYLLPAVPFLVILFSKGVVDLTNRHLKVLIVVLCLMQFAYTSFFVYTKRQLSSDEQAAFNFIKVHIPDNQFVLYPETILLEETGKKAIWGNLSLWPYFFWGNQEDKKIIIEENDLSYIVIKHTRIYDDSEKRHLGGYPQSFVRELSKLPFVKCIYRNNTISVWKIERGLTRLSRLQK